VSDVRVGQEDPVKGPASLCTTPKSIFGDQIDLSRQIRRCVHKIEAFGFRLDEG
jgi:hypothetical protein